MISIKKFYAFCVEIYSAILHKLSIELTSAAAVKRNWRPTLTLVAADTLVNSIVSLYKIAWLTCVSNGNDLRDVQRLQRSFHSKCS